MWLHMAGQETVIGPLLAVILENWLFYLLHSFLELFEWPAPQIAIIIQQNCCMWQPRINKKSPEDNPTVIISSLYSILYMQGHIYSDLS